VLATKLRTVRELFTNKEYVSLIQRKLPKLFNIAGVESSRAGKVGMQVGSLRVTFSGLSGSGTTYKVYANSYCNSSTHTNYTPSRLGDGTTGNEDTISMNYNTNIKVYYSTSSC
jgi:hypothetical protein